MQEILFTKEDCEFILSDIDDRIADTILNEPDRKYNEWLVTDSKILNFIFSKIAHLGIVKIKQGRILEYTNGCFFEPHFDRWEKYPDRIKTILIQLSDKTDYEGGVLTIDKYVFDKEIGNTVIFDGNKLHGMTPIIKGNRYVFVLWLERDELGIKRNLL